MSPHTYRNGCRWAAGVVAAIAIAVVLSGPVRQLLDERLIYHVNRAETRGAYWCLLAGADADARDSAGLSALHLAVVKDFDKTAELLASRANLETRDGQGRTLLHITALGLHEKYIKILLAGGADIEARDDQGATPLILALSAGKWRLAVMLVAAGAQVKVRRKDGLTPLHFSGGQRDVAEHLLAKGAEVNARDKVGKTPLMMAADDWDPKAGNWDPSVIRLLIAHGADINAVDDSGMTPVKIAEAQGNFRAVRVLMAAAGTPKKR
jgi:ankyrin repeat protein